MGGEKIRLVKQTMTLFGVQTWVYDVAHGLSKGSCGFNLEEFSVPGLGIRGGLVH